MLTDHLTVVYIAKLLVFVIYLGCKQSFHQQNPVYHFIFLQKFQCMLHETNKLFTYMHYECCVEIFSDQALSTKLAL